MIRLDLPLGALDLATPDAFARVGRGGVPLREASGVVPAGGGYLVPRPPAPGAGAAGLRAAAVQTRERYATGDGGEDGDDTDQPLTRVVGVTTSAVVALDPAGGTPLPVADLAADVASRRPQVAPAGGGALVVATGADAAPEAPLLVRGDHAVPFGGPGGRPWIPDARSIAAAPGTSGPRALPFGTYAVRLAALYRDGSEGPASMPVVVSHDAHAAFEDAKVGTAATAGAAVLIIKQPNLVELPEALLNRYYAAADGEGKVAVWIDYAGGPVRVVATSAEWTSGELWLTLEAPVPFDTVEDDGVAFGDAAALEITLSGYPAGLDADDARALFRGVAVYLSAPLGGSGWRDAPDAAVFRVGTVAMDDDEADGEVVVAMTVAELLKRPALADGALAAGLRPVGAGTVAGRVCLTGVALDPPPPAPGLSFVLDAPVSPATFVVAARLVTDSGPLTRWSAPFEADSGGLAPVSALWWYPSPECEALDIYKLDGSAYEFEGRVVLAPTATGGAAFAVRTGVVTGGTGDDAPDADGRAADNASLDTNARRCVLTGAGRTNEARAERVFEAGASGLDAVVGVSPLAAPLSAGQFGDFPVVVLCRASVWGLRLTATGEVEALAPVSVARGCTGPEAFVADGSALYYASADGIYALGLAGNLAAPLLAVEEGTGRPPAGVPYAPFADGGAAFDRDTVLSVYDDGRRRELWVTTATREWDSAGAATAGRRTFVLDLSTASTASPRWGVLARDRTGALRLSAGTGGASGGAFGALVTFDADGLWHEDGDGVGAASVPERWQITTATVDVADGLRASVRRAGVAGDLADSVLLSLTSRAATDGAGRSVRSDAPLVAALLAPARGHEATARANVTRAGLTLRPADGAAVTPGDRLTLVSLALDTPVRTRRRRALPT